MISTSDVSINLQIGKLNHQGIIDYWNTHNFGVVKISGKRNQCLQYSLNDFIVIFLKLKTPLFFGQFCIWFNIIMSYQ